MRKTTTTIAMIAGLMLAGAFTASAQTNLDPSMFLSISAGGQFQSRDFSETSTFNLFGDTGTVTGNQTIGSGFVFDASVGRRMWRSLSVAVGVSTFHGSGEAAALAAIPDPLVFGKPRLKEFPASDYGNLSQTTTSINFQAVWIKPLTDRLDLWLFAGPSIVHVNQEVASATETQNAVATTKNDSATSGKAGTIGVDLGYRMTESYSIGAFVRYAGGEVDLPSVPKMKVGGVQAGGGIRFRF